MGRWPDAVSGRYKMGKTVRFTLFGMLLICCVLVGCGTTGRPSPLPMGHLSDTPLPVHADAAVPTAVPPAVPTPNRPKLFSVVAYKLPVASLLFTLARDAKVNLDVHPAIGGEVTLNALNQTLPQILERVARQVPLRWTLESGVLTVMPDEPYWANYHIDYFNLSRKVRSSVSLANSVSGTGGSVSNERTGSAINSSTTEIESTADNMFWERLEAHLKAMLQVTERPVAAAVQVSSPTGLPLLAGTSTAGKTTSAIDVAEKLSRIEKNLAEAGRARAESKTGEHIAVPATTESHKPGRLVLVHPETGVIGVYATATEQLQVASFINSLGANAQRQVLIEATIVEVALSDHYQAGIDWGWLAASDKGWQVSQQTTGNNLGDVPLALISKGNPLLSGFNLTVKLLEQFGRTRVLSSPKIVAINNQPAVMKVVDEQVYFTLDLTEDQNSNGDITRRHYASKLHTVPVGLVLQVLTQVSATGEIALNVRPTITNIRSWVEDPAVALMSRDMQKPVVSQVPVLQVREFDSTLHVPSGQLAMLGGLIQDASTNARTGLPGLSRVAGLGDLFSYRDDQTRRIELVIFLRPRVIDGSTPNSALAQTGIQPPGDTFFSAAAGNDLSAFANGSVQAPEVTP